MQSDPDGVGFLTSNDSHIVLHISNGLGIVGCITMCQLHDFWWNWKFDVTSSRHFPVVLEVIWRKLGSGRLYLKL